MTGHGIDHSLHIPPASSLVNFCAALVVYPVGKQSIKTFNTLYFYIVGVLPNVS